MVDVIDTCFIGALRDVTVLGLAHSKHRNTIVNPIGRACSKAHSS